MTDAPIAGAPNRRIVTGLDRQGRSTVLFDDRVAMTSPVGGMVWRAATLPADNAGTADTAQPFDFATIHDGSANCLLVRIPPDAEPYMHATDTLDFSVVLSGELVLVLETGEVRARAGDFIVDRGVRHAMRNDTDHDALMAVITVPAHPVGMGRTV